MDTNSQQTPRSDHPRSQPAQKRNRASTAWIIIATLVALFSIIPAAWNSFRDSTAESPLQSPDFDDISAFAAADVARLDHWLQQQLVLGAYPSLSVAIFSGGKIAYQRAFGFSDINENRKATPETSYHVASVTKVFAASLAVLLHHRGIVDLDQSVVKYLPNVSISTTPELGAKITLRQLASHTSGLPRGIPGRVQSVEGHYQLEPERLYALLADVTLASAPGTSELYSNLGFGLLGHVLERAAGKPFDRLLQDMICEPLHLQRTAIHAYARLSIATGYSSSRPRRERAHSFRDRLAASGGLIASAPDLANFLAAQMKPGLFTSEMLDQLHTPSLASGRVIWTALGWSIDQNNTLGRILVKNGGRENCSAWIGFAPRHGVGVVVLANCGEPDVDQVGSWLLERSVPGAHKPVTNFGYAKVAPYNAIQWQDDQPIVRVADRWFTLVSIDGLPIARIVEFAKKEFGPKARMRIAEDLVEVLAKMGHEPSWSVTLGLKTNDGPVNETRVRMTEENRALIRD